MTMRINRPERLRQQPAVVLLDTDNTLYAYDAPHAAAMRAVSEKACGLLGIEPALFESTFDEARAEVKARLGATASSHSRLLYFQRTIERLGLKSQILLTLDLEQTYWRTFLSSARLFPDVREFLGELRALGVPIANLTDLTAQIQFRKLVYFGLDHHVDYVVTSEEAGSDKPAPATFTYALAKLGTTACPIWMIGDSATADIEGARTACDAVTFQKSHAGVRVAHGERAADVVFEHFSELRALLRELSAAPPRRAASGAAS